MAFRPAEFANMTKFNSADSSDFLDLYESLLDAEIKSNNEGVKHKSFAPSAFRCPRLSWFRLRGVQPDAITTPDRGNQFTADIGTACHRIIQRRLKAYLGQDWLDVKTHVDNLGLDYTVTSGDSEYESYVDCHDIPVRFACDGLIMYKFKKRLLEIKSCDHASFVDLYEPKPKHIDQVELYCERLHLNDVLFMYVDRQYDGIKCFEHIVKPATIDEVRSKCAYIMDMVDANIAPEGLPKGDPDCSPSMCPYHAKCKEWGGR